MRQSWRGPSLEDRLRGLLSDHDDLVLWIAIAALIVGTLARAGGRPRDVDYAMLALEQARSSATISVENASGATVVVLAGGGDYSVGYRVAAGSTQPFVTGPAPLRVLDAVTCATLATLAYPGSGTVVLREHGRADFSPGTRLNLGPFTSGDITYACTGRVRSEAPPVAHAGTIVGIGDDRLWSSAADGSLASFLPSDRMPLDTRRLADGRWLVSTAPGWDGLNAGLVNRWIVDPTPNAWTPFHDDWSTVAFSPDGMWMAFAVAAAKGDLRLAPTPTGDQQAVPANSRTIATGIDSVAWSPDSRHLLVTTASNPTDDVMKVELLDLSGRRTTLIDRAAREVEPAWSPDGRRVVVGLPGPAPEPGVSSHLVILDLGGGQVGGVVMPGQDLESPSFSPDGKRLAFVVVTYPYPNNAIVGRLMIASADGSNPAGSVDWLLGAQGAVWSPDGSAFVVARMEEMGPAQMVMGFVDGRPWKPVAESLTPLVWLA